MSTFCPVALGAEAMALQRVKAMGSKLMQVQPVLATSNNRRRHSGLLLPTPETQPREPGNTRVRSQPSSAQDSVVTVRGPPVPTRPHTI